MLKLHSFRSRAKGLPDLLPYAALIAPDVVLTKDGTFIAAWDIQGADTESSTDEELATVSSRVNAATRRLGGEWMLHVDTIRQPTSQYFPAHKCHFPDPVSQMLDEVRRQNFANGEYYISDTYLTACYKPSITDIRLTGWTQGNALTQEKDYLQTGLENFRKTLNELEDGLSAALKMNRLSSYTNTADDVEEHNEKAPTFSALLTFLQTCITGNEYNVRVPDTPMYLDALLGGQDLIGGLAPRIGAKHIAIIALDALPSESQPSMLSFLTSLPFSCRFSTRFICMDQFEALKEVEKYRKTWAQNIYKFFDKIFNKINPRRNADAVNMTNDAETAYASLQSGLISAGFYTANVIIMDEDAEALHDKVRLVQRALMSLGFGCRLEEINAVEAWLGSHPGNWWANVRRPIISTLNLADFLPLASVWTGSRVNPCPVKEKFFTPDAPALIQCATNSTTPFWFNLHVGDVGHTLIAGPTGSGKSTLLALIASQFRKYRNSSVFVFDKGMSMYALCKAVGGQHYDIGGDNSPSFAPLHNLGLGTAEAIAYEEAWAREWITTLCELQKLSVLPGHRTAINEAMISQSQKRGDKSLTSFHQFVQNREVKDALQHYTLRGGMGHLLDAKHNTLKKSTFCVFEIEELMNKGVENVLPVLLYLFHIIQRSLKKQPTLLILDEAWIMLGNSFFRAKIREWFKVMRKANCSVILATQSLSDLINSEILDVIMESCATHIFLANDKAREDVFMPMYISFGLNSRQIELIAEARPKREYYIASRAGRRMVNLDLTDAELAFYGASSKESLSRIKDLEKQFGTGWPQRWMMECGVRNIPDFERAA